MSSTVTVNEHDVPTSLETFTVVVPTLKKEPGAGFAVIAPQVPVVEGGSKFTNAPHWSTSLGTVILAGHVITQLMQLVH